MKQVNRFLVECEHRSNLIIKNVDIFTTKLSNGSFVDKNYSYCSTHLISILLERSRQSRTN